MALPKRTLDQAVLDMVKMLSPGNATDDVKRKVKSIVNVAIQNGKLSNADRAKIKQMGGGDPGPLIDDFLSQIISNEYALASNPNKFIQDRLSEIRKKPYQDAEDGELQSYLDQLNEIKGFKGVKGIVPGITLKLDGSNDSDLVSPEEIIQGRKNEAIQKLSQAFPNTSRDAISNYVEQIARSGNFDGGPQNSKDSSWGSEADRIFGGGNDSVDVGAIVRSVGDLSGNDLLTSFSGVDVSDDIKQVEELLGKRKFKSDQEGLLANYLTEGPKQFEAERNRFFANEGKRANDYITEEYIPATAEQLNAQGIYDSGELGGLVSRKYSDIQSSLEQEKLAQEQEDINFFYDLAYKKTYQDLIDTQQDISSKVQSDFSGMRQKQNQRFQTTQNNLNRKFSLDLIDKENTAAQDDYTRLANKKKQNESDALMADVVGAGVETIGKGTILKFLG